MFDRLINGSLVGRIDSTLAYDGTIGKGDYGKVVKVRRGDSFFAMKISRKEPLNREFGIQEALRGIRGVPEAMHLYGSRAFLMEFVDGTPLSEARNVSGDFFDKLRLLSGRINERGYSVPADLHDANILVGSNGDPWIVDFAQSDFYWLPAPRFVFDQSDYLIEKLMENYGWIY